MASAALRTDKVLLRPWRVEDARWYVEARDEETLKWTSESRTLTVTETEEAIRRVNASDSVFGFAIVDPNSSELLGNLSLVLDEHNRRSGEVMYWLATEGRGRGLASEAVRLLCQWAFATLGLEQVTLKTHVDNLRSQLVAKRASFQRVNDQDDRREQNGPLWFVLTRR